MTHLKNLLTTILFLSFFSLAAFSQTNKEIFSGKVLDSKGKAIEFANIYYKEIERTFYTNANGDFAFKYSKNALVINLKITFVGKQTLEKTIFVKDIQANNTFTLQDFSLNLNEIVVSNKIERTNNSNSSITYDKEAITQVQAFSLKDILNTLPGKTTIAPDINTAQTITLRGGDQGGSYALNNSLGVAIIIDDVVQSNDANMQSRSASRWGMSSANLSAAKSYGTTDVPYQGIDLREVPVESIEKVEVIQGVASAKYGELTDGAIIIERQAGKTPFQFTTNINGGSTAYALTKGFKLNKNWGALNTGLNYTKSNSDPRDKSQEYVRIATNLMWSKNFGKNIKNTLSIDYNEKTDEVKIDPDDDYERMSKSTNKSLRVSNRLSANLNTAVAKRLGFTFSYNKANQDSYSQYILNQGVKLFSNKDTTGIYEGEIISGRYTAVEQIIGKPITMSTNLNFNTNLETGKIKHNIGYGLSYNYSNNGGKGIVSDPDRPRWLNSNGQNERPYSFESTPSMHNIGSYIEDNISTKVYGKLLNANIGLRHDIQNGYKTLQPRINAALYLNKKWQINWAYGIATKAPTLAHRYPSPTWLDITLLSVLNSDQALHLVYTERIDPDNSHLKPSKTTQLETGVKYRDKFINTSLFAYYKKGENGFDTKPVFRTITLPKYAYEIVDSKLTYYPTSTYNTYTSLSDYQIYNIVSTDNYGLEFTLSTKKIKAIQTSFNFSTSYTYSKYFKDAESITALASARPLFADTAWYVVYPKEKKNYSSLMSKIGSSTHIPKIGIVINFNADIFWSKEETRDNEDWRNPIGYINNKKELYYFQTEAEQQEAINTLGLKTNSAFYSNQPIIYGIVNMSVAKEIKKNIRISITAYNALNLMPEKTYINPETGNEVLFKYNSPTSITGGISVKF